MSERYTYAYGYTSLEIANAALIDLIEGGQISRGEFPRVERYFGSMKVATPVGLSRPLRYRITLEAAA
jgi:hypothetical protein